MKSKINKVEEVELEVEDLELSENARALMLEEQIENDRLQKIVDLMAMSSPTNHPSILDVKNWKSSFGKVYLSSVTDESEVYVWRPILRKEWRELISAGFTDELLRQEALVGKCLLFPKKDTVLYERPAGVLSALETKIMFQSGFVPTEYLLSSIKEIN